MKQNVEQMKVSLVIHLQDNTLTIPANNLAAWNGSKLTGSGFIVRKPVGSGASQKSKKSVGSQSLGRPSLSPSPPLTRTPTSLLEKQAGDEMSIDQSQEYVPDLPDLSSKYYFAK